MFHIGVDLAWGTKRPTGLAVLDDAGRLVHVSTVHTDEEIETALSPYVEGDCLVAIDAPLIVSNTTGNRPAEAALNKDFAKFDAGAHPSNTGKPEFSGTPRGAGLCQSLGLDMNPRSGRARRAIEVYPHPATVALFELGRTLKYKHKTGPRPRPAARRAARADGVPRGSRGRRSRARAGARTAGWSCGARSRPPPARASCASPRTRSTRSSAPTSRCSPPGGRRRPRRTATSRPATSSRRRSRPGSPPARDRRSRPRSRSTPCASTPSTTPPGSPPASSSSRW